jgi:hypothetical protein
VLSDLRKSFNATRGQLTLLAVAADTDNTGEQAHAGFADFYFVDNDTGCFQN